MNGPQADTPTADAHLVGAVPEPFEFEGPVPKGQVVPIVFVGGTGRSGTHVIARLLGRSPRLRVIPVECRFHTDPEGFPGLLAGEVSKRAFIRRMQGFWWQGKVNGRVRGMFRFVPRERYDQALQAFDERFDADAKGACRALFLDILMPHAHDNGALGIVEQSCDVIAQAPTLVELFPEAKFIHVVRDGRDASASRVAQSRRRVDPRTRRQGIAWWERRIRAIDAGARAIPPERFLEVSLDELLARPKRGAVGPIVRFAGVKAGPKIRRFFFGQMGAEEANAERWKDGLSERKREQIDRLYEEALDRLEADGITCARLVRQTWERRRHPAFGIRPNP